MNLPAYLPGFEHFGKTFITVEPSIGGTHDICICGLTLESGFRTEDAARLRASGYVTHHDQLVAAVAERIEEIQTKSTVSSQNNADRIRSLNNARRKEQGRNTGRDEFLVQFPHAGFYWETVVRIGRDEAGFLMEETTDDWLVSVDGDFGKWLDASELVCGMTDEFYETLTSMAIAITKENL